MTLDAQIDEMIDAVLDASDGDDALAQAHAAEEVREVKERVNELASACQSALNWIENMKIVPGGERERLRDQLRRALGIER